MMVGQWDNELANNIPSLLAEPMTSPAGATVTNSSSATSDDFMDAGAPILTTTIVNSNKTSLSSSIGSLAPAPAPAISAWSKPINFSTSSPGAAPVRASRGGQQVVVADTKDKGDNHDSGIDVSDQPNSAASSTRSSPSADDKIPPSSAPSLQGVSPDSSGSHGLKRSESGSADQGINLPKPQRAPKVSKSDKLLKADNQIKVLNKMDGSLCKEMPSTKPEPIQMPPNFKDSIFGKGDDNGLQLDFRYDESLASPLSQNMPEQPGSPKVEVST